MGVIGRLFSIFKGKKEHQPRTFILREEPDVVKQVEDALKRENAQLKARVAELESKEEHRKKISDEELESKHLIKEAIEAKEKIEKRKLSRRAIFKVIGSPIKVRNLSERQFEYPYLYGIEIEHIEDEPEMDFRFNILLSKDKERKKFNGRIYGSPIFRNVFKNPATVVNSLNSGVIDLSVNDDGMFQPPYPQNVPPEIIINSIKGEYGEVINSLQSQIQKMRKQLSQESFKRSEAEKREVDVQDVLDETNATLEVAQKVVENRGAILSALIEKLKAKDTETMRFLIPALEAPINKTIQEMYAKQLEGLVDKFDARINEIIPEGKRKSVRNELLEDLEDFRNILPREVMIEKQKEGEVKGVTKAEVKPTPQAQ